jgi:anti-anti-sigma factor
MLTVTTEHFGNETILRCVGRIVRGQETAILCAAIEEHERDLVVDLAEVDAIDAAGIGLLVSLQAAGIYLKLVNPSKQVREVLRVTQLESVFEIYPSQSMEAMTESTSAGVSDNRQERLHAALL